MFCAMADLKVPATDGVNAANAAKINKLVRQLMDEFLETPEPIRVPADQIVVSSGNRGGNR